MRRLALAALVLDAGHRKIYFHTGWIGGLIGLPHVVIDLLVKRSRPPDWLTRTDRFVPIPRFEGLEFSPKMALLLLVAGLIWVWFRRRDSDSSVGSFILGSRPQQQSNPYGLPILRTSTGRIWVYDPCIGVFLLLVIAGELSVRGRWSRPVLLG